MEKEFKPIYGWGWHSEQCGSLDVPSDLAITISSMYPTYCEGIVKKPMAYLNWKAHIVRRSNEEQVWNYNVILDSPDEKERVTGFAQGEPLEKNA